MGLSGRHLRRAWEVGHRRGHRPRLGLAVADLPLSPEAPTDELAADAPRAGMRQTQVELGCVCEPLHHHWDSAVLVVVIAELARPVVAPAIDLPVYRPRAGVKEASLDFNRRSRQVDGRAWDNPRDEVGGAELPKFIVAPTDHLVVVQEGARV